MRGAQAAKRVQRSREGSDVAEARRQPNNERVKSLAAEAHRPTVRATVGRQVARGKFTSDGTSAEMTTSRRETRHDTTTA